MKYSELLMEVNKWIGKKGNELFEKYGVKTDWCMMLVYYFMHDYAGIKDFPLTFSCSDFTTKDFVMRRLNHDFKTAEIGDIITFELNDNIADGADHVGIVIENTGNTIKLLEGNTRGSRNGTWYETSTANVFEYPYYTNCFDYIVDMSDFFSDGDNVTHPPDNAETDDIDRTFGTFQPRERRIIRKGSKGAFIKTLQQLLFAKGYDCGADDGDFGNKTEKCVKAFQKDHKLDDDGIVGILTFEELIGK